LLEQLSKDLEDKEKDIAELSFKIKSSGKDKLFNWGKKAGKFILGKL
jgi:hypothetical protein